MSKDNNTIKIKQLISGFFNNYFITCNFEEIKDILDDNISYIDVQNAMIISGKKGVEEALESPISFKQKRRIDDFVCEILNVNNQDDFFLATGIVVMKTFDNQTDALVMRYSFTIKKYGDVFKIFHCHFSVPTYSFESNNINSSVAHSLVNQQKQIENQNIEYESFLGNMNGAAIEKQLDDEFTIDFISNGFYKVFGYNKEYVNKVFENKYINIILNEDRKNVINQIKTQLENSNEYEAEYRIKCESGHILWAMERGNLIEYANGKKVIYSLVMDITALKKAQEELKLSLERHQIILEQTNDIVFEWDLIKDTIYFSNNWEKTFGYKPITEEIDSTFFKKLQIHPEDLQGFYDMVTDVLNGEKHLEYECRLQKSNKSYLWVKIKFTTQQDENNKPIKGVGVIINIDEAKTESLRLLRKTQIDPLTQVYNKLAAEILIKKYLKKKPEDEVCALIILDADYFKTINDENGHYFGDVFLKEAANTLKNTVNERDIVGRMGGDEFIILLKNIYYNDYAIAKSGEINDAFRKIKVNAHKEKIVQTKSYSCSIGVAFYDSSLSFEELYKRADRALYKAKENGRDCFYVYED